MRYVVGASTDQGLVRDHNEDDYIADARLRLYAVADGMGGHRGGEVASATALEALRAAVASGASIDAAVTEANRAVHDKAAGDADLYGMGTTLTAVLPQTDGNLLIGHVGDSRAYLLRDADLRQLTNDHSLVEEMVREGRLTEEQAAVHPQRSIITRALGVESNVEVDVYSFRPRDGDRLLICSDGLTTMVRADDIATVLRREHDPSLAAHRLVDLANDAGGEDNITVMVIDAIEDGADPLGPLPVAPSSDSTTVLPATPDAQPDASDEVIGAPIAPNPERPPGARDDPRSRDGRARSTLRSVGRGLRFAVPILAILAIAVGAVAWYARQTFYVGFDDQDRVTLFQGRPGGMFVWEPTIVRTTDIRRDGLRDESLIQTLDADVEFSSKSRADAYLVNLERDFTATTTTTTTTTTTVPVAPVDPNAPAPTAPAP